MAQLLPYRPLRLFNDKPNTHFRVRANTRIINWGNSRPPVGDIGAVRVSNSFAAVAAASNKLVTFRALENKDGIRIPEFTDSHTTALSWLNSGSGDVVVRSTLTGHSGAGITIAKTPDQLILAPLYVKYVKKQKEFRVHVAFGEVIDVQEKRKRRDDDNGESIPTNYQIRNHHTGWVYCRENISLPRGCAEMATTTVRTLGLDFGAVDLIYNEKRDEIYVLEVNTAPGLEGTTVEKYANAFVRNLVQ